MRADGQNRPSAKAYGVANALKLKNSRAASPAVFHGILRSDRLSAIGLGTGGATPRLPTPDERGLTGASLEGPVLGAVFDPGPNRNQGSARQGFGHARRIPFSIVCSLEFLHRPRLEGPEPEMERSMRADILAS